MIYIEATFEDFWRWLQNSEGYKNNFSYEGAEALFEHLEQLSEDMAENMSFDPIAWCVGYSEFDSVREAYKYHYGDDSDLPKSQRRTTRKQQLEYFTDNTIVIEVGKHIIIEDF